ncbi:CAMK family protein kinase [Tritrichomonas foetus]|uniref:CAMK family protein kinase n=1 Tax=Tritrichomonas foetus TaxID=1144522 RepID=A0A1J4JWZ0_9EUKA|nr:CAMK family protein kinase [Tritrichomonas foetus]|eukprot:OHT01789.1 CAMK family protein kinase [Tritrichomonas foetus]
MKELKIHSEKAIIFLINSFTILLKFTRNFICVRPLINSPNFPNMFNYSESKNDSASSSYSGSSFIKHLCTSDSDSEEEERKPKKQINQYLILGELGEGSFAKVFLARNTITNKLVALKQFKLKRLQHKENGVSQLEREISAMRRFQHDNILHLHEVLHEESSDTVYLVIDYADCGSLLTVLTTTGVFGHIRSAKNDTNEFYQTENENVVMIKYIFHKILQAVLYLHAHGIVHQDIKPSNILINSDGEVYLSDFGVGHSFGSAEMVVGSPGYQAPEAIADFEFDDSNPAEEDVWSLGVTLFQSFFGRLPFEGDSIYEIIKDIKSSPLRIPSEEKVDPELVRLLKGMLEVDQRKRMTISEILSSSFFSDLPDKLKIDAKLNDNDNEELLCYQNGRNLENNFNENTKIVNAKVCDVNYSFARPSLTSCNLIRMLSLNMYPSPRKQATQVLA